MATWNYTIEAGDAKVSFTITPKNSVNDYGFTNFALTGSSFAGVDECKKMYQAIVAIIEETDLRTIVAKCKAAATTRERIMTCMRAGVQYSSRNLLMGLDAEFKLTVKERLQVLDWMNERQSASNVRKAMFGDVVGTHKVGDADVTYAVKFGDTVKTQFTYMGTDTANMTACIEFAKELQAVCEGATAHSPALVAIGKLVAAYGVKPAQVPMLAPTTADACTSDADPSVRRFVISIGGSSHTVLVATDGKYTCCAPSHIHIINTLEELRRGRDIMPHIKSDIVTWYSIAVHIGRKDYAESMRWRQFDIHVGGKVYMVAFDRSGWDWKPVTEVSDGVMTKCNDIIKKYLIHSCACDKCEQTISDYNRIYTWVHKAEVGGIDKAERDALIEDRNRWHA